VWSWFGFVFSRYHGMIHEITRNGRIRLFLLRVLSWIVLICRRQVLKGIKMPSSSFSAFRPFAGALLLLIIFTPACVKRPRIVTSSNKSNQQGIQTTQTKANDQQPSLITNQRPININTARANELETLPGIGKGLAERIIENRERFGPFRRIEHLIVVRGISDRRFRALRELVTVE
jgi:competence ComEA-like helix-hairpin-helix protein